MKILALKHRQLGDTVLWTAALQALRELHPAAEIDLVLPSAYAELFGRDSRFKTLFPIGRDGASLYYSQWKNRGYDLALAFHASSLTRKWARAAGAKQCLIHHHSRKGLRFGSDLAIVDAGKPMGATERDLNVIRTLGWKGTAPATALELPPSPALGWNASPLPRIVFGPAASRPAKRWPLQNYLSLAERLAPHAQVRFIAPSAAEFSGQEAWFSADKPWIFTPTLAEATAVLKGAQFYVGSDSGLKHLAIALGLRTLTLFGPESVGEWHPYDLKTHPVLRQAVECRTQDADKPEFAWCGVYTCPLASHACLSLTTPERVA
ncbi:glycosyltransferase family 9 protein, partial [bacterium]|nr:glycosyltransferase family 9 protein [bacterium]